MCAARPGRDVLLSPGRMNETHFPTSNWVMVRFEESKRPREVEAAMLSLDANVTRQSV